MAGKEIAVKKKRRLRDVAQLRRTAKTTGFGQADEVFKPFGFHGGIMGLAGSVRGGRKIGGARCCRMPGWSSK